MMKTLLRALSVAAAISIDRCGHNNDHSGPATGSLIQDRYASVGGLRLHYLAAGKGELVILLHGYAQNSHMWRPLIFPSWQKLTP